MSDQSPEAEPPQMALRHMQRGEAAAVEARCRQALERDPARTDVLGVLGVALAAQARPAEAARIFEKLTELQPGDAGHWINLGTMLRRLRRHDEALLSYARAAGLGERSASFLYNVALLHQDRGDFDTARCVFADAVAQAPRDAEIVCQYAQCCYESQRVDEALAALADWRNLKGLTGERLAGLALLLMSLGDAAGAREAQSMAAAVQRPGAATLLHLAQAQERANRVAEALDTLTRLRAAPDAAGIAEEIELLEAQLASREGRTEEAVQRFARLAESCDKAHRRHLYLFPLAKALDGAGRYDEAYARLVEAHAAQMLHVARSNPHVAAYREPPLLIIRHGCDVADIALWDESDAPAAEASPVFIVAFPRSGTTLLEHMLDAHPGLITMDEQPFLQQAIDRIAGFGIDYPAQLSRLTRSQLDEVRDYYWSLARGRIGLRDSQRLIDKNPLNLMRLPAIRRLFPRAKILLALRHPCDVVLSCFMQHFRAPEFALMCRDLPTLARGLRRSFDFWYAQSPLLRPDVREVRYEHLVSDFPRHARGIAEFLELPWHDAMLEPGANARARGFISTPSYAQVIEPVTRRSIGRWKHYEKYFTEAVEELKPYLQRWSYAL